MIAGGGQLSWLPFLEYSIFLFHDKILNDDLGNDKLIVSTKLSQNRSSVTRNDDMNGSEIIRGEK